MDADTQQILARSKLYKLFALALHYPGSDLIAMLNEGFLAESFARLLEIASPDLCVKKELALLKGSAGDLELGAEYNRLFEVGEDGHAPCSLFGGTYSNADRHKVLEETVRFYNHFGLQIDQNDNEMPDQLGTELEFLHFLAYRQVELIESSADSSDYVRAERDFLQRHPGKWVPTMQSKLEEENGKPFYSGVVGLLKAYLSDVTQGADMPASQLIPISAQQ